MLTMAAAPLRLSCGRQALAKLNAPSRMTPITSRHSSSVIWSNAFSPTQCCVVDKTVDAAEALRRRRGHTRHGGRIGDVAETCDRLAAADFDRIHHRIRFRAIRSRIDDDGRAAGRQFERDRASDVAPAPVTMSDTAGEFQVKATSTPLSADRSSGPANSLPHSCNASSVRAASQPPWRALEANFSSRYLSRQRLVGAAAHVRLALFDDIAVAQQRPHMAGIVPGVGIVPIQAVADLGGDREHGADRHGRVGEGVRALRRRAQILMRCNRGSRTSPHSRSAASAWRQAAPTGDVRCPRPPRR